jgi:hypothetical protein
MTAITPVSGTASQTKAGGPSQTDSKPVQTPVQQVEQKTTEGGGAAEQASEGAKALKDAKIAEILEQLIKVLTELIAALKDQATSGGGDTTQKSTDDKKTDGGGGEEDPDLPPDLNHDSTPHGH